MLHTVYIQKDICYILYLFYFPYLVFLVGPLLGSEELDGAARKQRGNCCLVSGH